MDNTRLSKIERLIQKELGDIFQRQTQAMRDGVLVSVSVVRVSPDLSLAKVYLSIFPSRRTDELMYAIKANTRTIRYDLGQRVRTGEQILPLFRGQRGLAGKKIQLFFPQGSFLQHHPVAKGGPAVQTVRKGRR